MIELHINGDRAYNLIEKIGPNRLGGSPREAQAAQVLMSEIHSIGVEPQQQVFQLHSMANDTAELEIITPFQERIPCKVVGFSSQPPSAAIEAEIAFCENAEPKNLSDIKGKIALVFNRLPAAKYHALIQSGAVAFISIGEAWRDEPVQNMVCHDWFDRWGPMPGVCITHRDGLRLIKENARLARLVCRQHVYQSESRNLFVEIAGTKYPSEVILIGAHYDSHREMDGAQDNGAGTAVLMELLRHFAANPPKRTLRFVWFGSEEVGCLGSRAFVKKHQAGLASILLMVNLDLGGGIIGHDRVDVMGEKDLLHHLKFINKERGLGLYIREEMYSGDPIPFVMAGVPSVCIYREDGTEVYDHTSKDSLSLVDGIHLKMLAEITAEFVDFAANAYIFPFERKIPQAMKDGARKMHERFF